MIKNATTQVLEARARHRREIVERTRLRRLVERVDRVIEACEETHLQGIKEVPAEITERSTSLYAFARRAVRVTRDEAAIALVEETAQRRQLKITELMDCLWTIQEVVFDLMLPWRTELPEDVELPGVPATHWRIDAA